MDRKTGRTISLVVLAIVIIQIIIIVVKYINSFKTLDNPLIPQNLLMAIRDYSITVVSIYLIAVLANLFYLFKKKFFWYAMLISFLALTVVALWGHNIQNYFFNIK